MAWIIGKKSDQSIIEISNKQPDFYLDDNWIDKRTGSILATQQEIDACFTTDVNNLKIVHAKFFKGLNSIIPETFGGTSSDYSFLKLTSEEINRILDGAAYTIVWVDGVISSIDFSLEDGKPWAKVSSDQEFIANDGIDSATLTLEIWKTDLSGIDTAFQFPGVRIPIKTPDGQRTVRFDIVNGTASRVFKTTRAGTYTFPGVAKRYNSVRLFNQIKIEVDDVDILS